MTREIFISIMKKENCMEWEGDNAFKGLQIISKYTDNLIQGARKDIIYSEDIAKLIEAGITQKDIYALFNLNWMIEGEEYLACFV